jgi:hypothetical protein
MNKLITTMLAVTGLAFSAQAKVGWTLEQARAHYGKEVKSEVAWCGGTAYGFIHDGLYIYAVISSGDTIGNVICFYGLVYNDIKPEKLVGFQVRSTSQFDFEQKSIK